MPEEKAPDGLPAGWTVNRRVRKNGKKDVFYTDPVTGYVFRSLKDVNRYLKTGVVGKLAFKPKVGSKVDMESNDEKLTIDSTVEGEKSADKGTNGQKSGYESSKLVETGNDELTFKSTDTINAVVCISENASEPSRENVTVGDVNIPEASGLDAREEKTETELKEKQATQDKKNKSSEKSKTGLPQRASKRLAGVLVDLPRDPKNRRQDAAGCETNVTTNISSNEKEINSPVLPRVKNLPNLGKPAEEVESDNNHQESQDGEGETNNKPKEKQDGNGEADKIANEKQQHTSKEHGGNVGTEERDGEVEITNLPMEGQEPPNKLPPVNITISEKDEVTELVMKNIPNEKPELPNYLTRTTTEDHGEKVERVNNKDFKASDKQELSDIFPPADFLIPGQCPGSMGTDKKADTIKPESPVNFSLTDLWADPCIEFAVKTLTGSIPVGEENKVDTYSESPLDLPLGGLWTDPCIDFAVKTLTGAVPVGEDLNVKKYFQRHGCSSENQGLNGPTLSDVNITNFSQTEFVSHHFNNAENSVPKQEFTVPMLPNRSNGSLQLQSGTDFNQHAKGNNGECSRRTFFK